MAPTFYGFVRYIDLMTKEENVLFLIPEGIEWEDWMAFHNMFTLGEQSAV